MDATYHRVLVVGIGEDEVSRRRIEAAFAAYLPGATPASGVIADFGPPGVAAIATAEARLGADAILAVRLLPVNQHSDATPGYVYGLPASAMPVGFESFYRSAMAAGTGRYEAASLELDLWAARTDSLAWSGIEPGVHADGRSDGHCERGARYRLGVAAAAAPLTWDFCGGACPRRFAIMAGQAAGAPLTVVAAENVYGDVAAQVGGEDVSVTSILDRPNQDPHLFEASASVAKALTQARITIAEGGGYDPWMATLPAAAPAPGRTTIVVANLLGKRPDANPHLWYDPATMPAVAGALAAAMSAADSPHETAYKSKARRLPPLPRGANRKNRRPA